MSVYGCNVWWTGKMSLMKYTHVPSEHHSPLAALERMACLVDSTDQAAIQLPSGAMLKPGLDLSSDAASLRQSVQRLRSGLCDVLVAGRFKNGKSSLVNALLGAQLAPIGITPTTAVVTRMVQGDTLTITVHRRLGTTSTIDWPTFVRDYTIPDSPQAVDNDEEAIAEHFADVDLIEVAYPFPLLVAGATIVDTPGLGENRLRTNLALEHLPRASAIVVVLDAKQPLSHDEQIFIGLLGIGKLPHVFFVINKFDLIEQHEQAKLRTFFAQRLRPMFCDEAGNFDSDLFARRVFYTDARTALRASTSEPFDEVAYRDSGVAGLRATLVDYLRDDDRRIAQLRSLIPVLDFHAGYVAELPIIKSQKQNLSKYLETCLHLKRHLVATDPTERSFSGVIRPGGAVFPEDPSVRSDDDAVKVGHWLISATAKVARDTMNQSLPKYPTMPDGYLLAPKAAASGSHFFFIPPFSFSITKEVCCE
ncbi:MAG: hypothetical protein EOM24_25780, partial [Chloroflexia bacterium]|nr:hypothetical protein [Chloroflexia bacterium]